MNLGERQKIAKVAAKHLKTEQDLNEFSAKFTLNVLTELQNRGVKDILIACVDSLKGFPDAIQTVFPQTQRQLRIMHMLRNSMKFVPWKDYKVTRRWSKTNLPVSDRGRGLVGTRPLCRIPG